MLLRPSFHKHPFNFITIDNTFSEEQCVKFETLFSSRGDWQHRDGGFYQCSILDVTTKIPLILQRNLIARMRDISNLPLSGQMVITAQHMHPGQAIGIHSDRPLLGYELLRLVVQLNRNWRSGHGGLLELFSSDDGDAVAHVEPLYNRGFIFELNDDSYHGVSEAIQPRRSLVFNFWHAANTPELEQHINNLFANCHFSELPNALEPIASTVEADLAEETTLIAETAAVALKRWGFNDAAIIAGYQFSVGQISTTGLNAEIFAAVSLAHWVATLYRKSFNLDEWRKLNNELAGLKVPNRLKNIWPLCLPQVI